MKNIRRMLPLAVLLMALAVTATVALTSHSSTAARNRLHFESEVDRAEAVIMSRFDLYVAVLRGGAALFAADPAVDRAHFRSFVERLDIARRYPGAQGIGFSLYLGEDPALPAGLPEHLRIWPPLQRSEYHSIIFLEPEDRRNRAALGYDMSTEPVRRRAMAEARDTTSAIASGKVMLVQEIDQQKQPGFLIYVPVYRSESVPESETERRRLLHGFVYAPFRAGDAFNAIFPKEYRDFLHVDVFDGSGTDPANRLYRSEGPPGESYESIRELHHAGRTWTLRYTARPRFAQHAERSGVLWIVLIGSVASVLLSWTLRREGRAREKAETVAAQLSTRTEDLRYAYDEVSRSKRQYREILDTAHEAIWTCDAKAVTTFANEAAARLVGCATDDLIGRPVFDFMDDDTADVIREKMRTRGRCTERYETRLGRLDGTAVSILVSATPLHDSDGRYTGTLAMLTDITSQRKAEEERDHLNRRLKGILESMGEGLIAFNQDRACTLMNGSAARLLGLQPAQAAGRDVHELLCGTQPHTCDLRTALTAPAGSMGESNFMADRGTSFSAEYAVSPVISDAEPSGFVLTFRDVTEQRFLRNQLEQAQRLSSLGRLAASIAHEFNNVLMVIQPFAELIARPDVTFADLQIARDQITNAVHRGKHSTEDILSFTRDTEPRLRPLNVAAYLDRVTAQVRPCMPAVTLEVEVETNDVYIAGDGAQLEQVITNLLLNARDAAATRIVISAEECVSGRTLFPFGTMATPDRFVHLSITDDGAGMTPDVLERIFEPLFTTKHSGGTGLGLPIAQQIILKHGGSINVRSQPGKGTRFDILLRRDIAPQGTVEETQPCSAAPARILIVDDELSIVAGITALLEIEGHCVSTVATATATSAAIEQFQPDVVVMDVGLPDMDGRDLYATIHQRWPDLPVIFSTGHATVAVPARGQFLRKPYEIADLLHAIGSVQADVVPMLTAVS